MNFEDLEVISLYHRIHKAERDPGYHELEGNKNPVKNRVS